MYLDINSPCFTSLSTEPLLELCTQFEILLKAKVQLNFCFVWHYDDLHQVPTYISLLPIRELEVRSQIHTKQICPSLEFVINRVKEPNLKTYKRAFPGSKVLAGSWSWEEVSRFDLMMNGYLTASSLANASSNTPVLPEPVGAATTMLLNHTIFDWLFESVVLK